MTAQRGRQLAGAILALGGLAGLGGDDAARHYAGSLSIIVVGVLMISWNWITPKT